LPRNCLTLNGIHIIFYSHAINPTISAQKQKTYGRLLGMIFLEGHESMLDTASQWLATRKIIKNRKNTKKSVILFGAEGPFSAKTPQKRPVFCVSTKLSRTFFSLKRCGRGNYS